MDYRFFRVPLTVAIALGLGPLGLLHGQQSPRSPKPKAVEPAADKGLFDEVPVVQAATLHMQTLEEAPANVTVISAADIRNFGYRSLGEALSSVRGFYITDDRVYNYGGVRGISVPGDYNTRFLVMINGHPMTENIYNSNNFFNQDFGLDMDLVERIEIIRGPSSALYGSNGMLANINVVTKSPVDHERVRVSSEFDTIGQRKTSMSTSLDLGKGANLLFAGSVFNYGTRDFEIAGLGRATNTGEQKGYHTFANLIWRDWRFTTYFNSREIHPPVGWAQDALFNHRGNRVRDSRNFAEAAYTRSRQNGHIFRWNFNYDNYDYLDRFFYGNEGVVSDNRTLDRGDWLTTQASYSIPFSGRGTFTFGGMGRFDVRAVQRYASVAPEQFDYVHLNNPDRGAASFAQMEWDLTKKLKATTGLRFDASRNFDNFLSPQAALVYQYSPRTTHKLVYGRPFRNPSSFEQYFRDETVYAFSGGHLRQERAHALEYSAERKLGRSMTAIANFYQYRINDLIQAVVLDDGFQQYQNTGAFRSTGAEFELGGVAWERLQFNGSFAVQKAAEVKTSLGLENSPRHLAKLRAATPLFKQRLLASAMVQYIGERRLRDGGVADPAALVDVTFTTNRLHPQFDIQFGVRNAMDRRYFHPIALSLDRMLGDGRSVYVKLLYNLSNTR